MFKRIMVIGLVSMVGFGMVGCDENISDTQSEETKTTVEQNVNLDEEEKIEKKEFDESKYKFENKELEELVHSALEKYGEPEIDNSKNKEFIYFTDMNYKLHKQNEDCNCFNNLSTEELRDISQRQNSELLIITVQEFNELKTEMNIKKDLQSKFEYLDDETISKLDECDGTELEISYLDQYISKELKDKLIEHIVERYNLPESANCSEAVDGVTVSNYVNGNSPLRLLVIEELQNPTESKQEENNQKEESKQEETKTVEEQPKQDPNKYQDNCLRCGKFAMCDKIMGTCDDCEGYGQCYDCGEYKLINGMTFDGRCYHCGCKEEIEDSMVPDEFCVECGLGLEAGNIYYGHGAPLCYDCYNNIYLAVTRCTNCGGDVEDNGYVHEGKDYCPGCFNDLMNELGIPAQ